MSGEDEGFLGRWSRRKQEVQEEEKKQQEVAALPPEQQKISALDAEAKEEEPKFDISTLPSIDSIVAGTDIRAFLSKGVPAALTQAALRKAWSADPAIRDYIGLSENSWDFNALDGQHGFAPLSPNTDIKQMLSEIFGDVRESAEKLEKIADAAIQDAPPVNVAENSVRISDSKAPREPAGPSDSVETTGEEESAVGDKTAQIEAAPQQEAEDEMEPLPRRHGSALPT